jgi:methylated-DNA-[protein]-cysteine S-methyltransferase
MHGDDFCYALIETDIGPVGIAWTPRGLARVMLPARDREATLRRLLRDIPDAAEAPPPPSLAPLVDGLKAYGRGEQVDFSDVPVDLSGLDRFHSAIYAALARVGYGETTTYGALAAEAGFPSAARETGAALGRNPVPLVLPCHRVLAAGGALGGFSAPGGTATKEKLLALEGVRTGPPEQTQTSFAF